MSGEFLEDVEVTDFEVEYQFDLTKNPVIGQEIRRGGDDQSGLSFGSQSTHSQVSVGMALEEDETPPVTVDFLTTLKNQFPAMDVDKFINSEGQVDPALAEKFKALLLGL